MFQIFFFHKNLFYQFLKLVKIIKTSREMFSIIILKVKIILQLLIIFFFSNKTTYYLGNSIFILFFLMFNNINFS